MPAIKLRLLGRNKGSVDEKPEVTVPHKKRRTDSSDDEELESGGKNEGKDHSIQEQNTRRRRMSHGQAPEPNRLFDDDIDVDVVNGPGSDDIPDRAPTPSAGPSLQKRGKKKKTAVYSDEDEEFIDSGRKQDDGDDDFVVDSPPRKPVARKAGAGGAKARGKGAKEKGGGVGEIMIKDERRVAPSSAAPAADAKAGAKRRRETFSELKTETKVDVDSGAATAAATQPSSSSAAGPSTSQLKESMPAVPPPSKIRKLPPIKKNKALAGATSSVPASSLVAKYDSIVSGATSTPTSDARPIHMSLPRKPLQKTSDLDLSSPDIYNSLFKSGSSAPRVGVNSRVKEEERRKELMKMRDEARAARMVQLQKNTFDLLAPQEKIARFELKLRERNTSAVYPNHLAASLKIFQLKKDAGCLPARPGPGLGPGGG